MSPLWVRCVPGDDPRDVQPAGRAQFKGIGEHEIAGRLGSRFESVGIGAAFAVALPELGRVPQSGPVLRERDCSDGLSRIRDFYILIQSGGFDEMAENLIGQGEFDRAIFQSRGRLAATAASGASFSCLPVCLGG